jgi:hypothetical protein
MFRIPVAFMVLGYENNRETIINVLRNARTSVNTVIDALQPVVNTQVRWIPDEILAARKRGVKFRTVTDVTIDNLQHCKKMMARIDELRHVSGIGVNFVVTDMESIVMVPTDAPREEARLQVIHSDSESVVEYKRLCFMSLWDKSAPGQVRIDELEDVAGGNRVSIPAATNVIDRIYECKVCKQTFIYSVEVEEHRKTGHEEFREYPIL